MVIGTPFSLHYSSDRVPGRRDAYTLEIPLSGASVPDSLKSIHLDIQVAGQRLTRSFPAAANQSFTFTWEGKDAYGRTLQGVRTVTIRLGYTYGAVYLEPADITANFGRLMLLGVTGVQTRRDITIWREWDDSVGAWDARGQVLGGWSLSLHHAYDPLERVVHMGDGRRRSDALLPSGIITVVGSGERCRFSGDPCGDGGPATEADLGGAGGITWGPDGGLYFADSGTHRLRRVSPDGILTNVAGSGFRGFKGCCNLTNPADVSVGPDGSIYIADQANHLIRRLEPDGTLTDVAGNREIIAPALDVIKAGFSGDGGPATEAQLNSPFGVAVASDGDGNVTTIERDGEGNPTAIVAPGGQRTSLTLNADGYFASVANPAGETHLFTYHDERGLLASFTDPRQAVTRFTYDALGRLARHEDPAEGIITLTRTETTNGYKVALGTVLGRTIAYEVERLPTDDVRLRACECFEVPLVVSAMVVEENALASFNELGIR